MGFGHVLLVGSAIFFTVAGMVSQLPSIHFAPILSLSSIFSLSPPVNRSPRKVYQPGIFGKVEYGRAGRKCPITWESTENPLEADILIFNVLDGTNMIWHPWEIQRHS
jgi:hypothetical protein